MNTYDALNRLTQVTAPAWGSLKYGYDANEHLTSLTDPKRLTTTYSHDGLDNLLHQISPDTGTTTNTLVIFPISSVLEKKGSSLPALCKPGLRRCDSSQDP